MIRFKTKLTAYVIAAALVATFASSGAAFAQELDPLTQPSPEPSALVSVVTLGDVGLDVGDRVSFDELVAAAAEVGQDVETQLDGRPQSEQSAIEAPLAVAAASAWDEVSRWNDNKGVAVVLRYGDGSSWGWIKLRDKHGITQNMLRKTTQFPRDRVAQRSAWVYTTPAILYSCWLGVCTVEKSQDVKVVNETTSQKGIITAYCVGLTICPKWVRDVAA